MGFGGEAAVHLRESARALALAVGREVVARGDREVAQGGQDLRGHALAHLAVIFIVGEVAAGGNTGSGLGVWGRFVRRG